MVQYGPKIYQEIHGHATFLNTEHSILFTCLHITAMAVTTVPNIIGMYILRG